MLALAMLLALAQPPTHLSIEPWTGSDYATASAVAAKYRLKVTGTPNASLHLRALRVTPGWLAAFCTSKLCSPGRVDLVLPASGSAVLQFELIRESGDAAKRGGATITDDAGDSVEVRLAA
jgi:hypothetical protein